jgi:hypothetical protein
MKTHKDETINNEIVLHCLSNKLKIVKFWKTIVSLHHIIIISLESPTNLI